MTTREFRLIQAGEVFYTTDDRKRAMTKAMSAAMANGLAVTIEEYVTSATVHPNGFIKIIFADWDAVATTRRHT